MNEYISKSFNNAKFLQKIIELDVVKVDKLVVEIINTHDVKKIHFLAVVLSKAGRFSKYAGMITDSICKAREPYYMYLLAKDVKGAILDQIVDTLIELEAIFYLIFLAKDVPMAPINKISKAIIATKNGAFIYQFAKEVPNVPVNDLEKAIIEFGTNEHIVNFAEFVPKAHIEKLAEVIMETNDINAMALFMLKVKNAPKEALLDKIMSIKINKKNAILLNLAKSDLKIRKMMLSTKNPILVQIVEQVENEEKLNRKLKGEELDNYFKTLVEKERDDLIKANIALFRDLYGEKNR